MKSVIFLGSFLLVSYVQSSPYRRKPDLRNFSSRLGETKDIFIAVNHDRKTGRSEKVCMIDGVSYRDGDSVPTSNQCEFCMCRPPGFACSFLQCPPPRNKGCRTLKKSGACCPEYQCDCEKDGKFYKSGQKIIDPKNPCDVCFCQGGDLLCSKIHCFTRKDCDGVMIPGRCCPSYDHCDNLQIGTSRPRPFSFSSPVTHQSFFPTPTTRPMTINTTASPATETLSSATVDVLANNSDNKIESSEESEEGNQPDQESHEELNSNVLGQSNVLPESTPDEAESSAELINAELPMEAVNSKIEGISETPTGLISTATGTTDTVAETDPLAVTSLSESATQLPAEAETTLEDELPKNEEIILTVESTEVLTEVPSLLGVTEVEPEETSNPEPTEIPSEELSANGNADTLLSTMEKDVGSSAEALTEAPSQWSATAAQHEETTQHNPTEILLEELYTNHNLHSLASATNKDESSTGSSLSLPTEIPEGASGDGQATFDYETTTHFPSAPSISIVSQSDQSSAEFSESLPSDYIVPFGIITTDYPLSESSNTIGSLEPEETNEQGTSVEASSVGFYASEATSEATVVPVTQEDITEATTGKLILGDAATSPSVQLAASDSSFDSLISSEDLIGFSTVNPLENMPHDQSHSAILVKPALVNEVLHEGSGGPEFSTGHLSNLSFDFDASGDTQSEQASSEKLIVSDNGDATEVSGEVHEVTSFASIPSDMQEKEGSGDIGIWNSASESGVLIVTTTHATEFDGSGKVTPATEASPYVFGEEGFPEQTDEHSVTDISATEGSGDTLSATEMAVSFDDHDGGSGQDTFEKGVELSETDSTINPVVTADEELTTISFLISEEGVPSTETVNTELQPSAAEGHRTDKPDGVVSGMLHFEDITTQQSGLFELGVDEALDSIDSISIDLGVDPNESDTIIVTNSNQEIEPLDSISIDLGVDPDEQDAVTLVTEANQNIPEFTTVATSTDSIIFRDTTIDTEAPASNEKVVDESTSSGNLSAIASGSAGTGSVSVSHITKPNAEKTVVFNHLRRRSQRKAIHEYTNIPYMLKQLNDLLYSYDSFSSASYPTNIRV